MMENGIPYEVNSGQLPISQSFLKNLKELALLNIGSLCTGEKLRKGSALTNERTDLFQKIRKHKSLYLVLVSSSRCTLRFSYFPTLKILNP